VAHVKQPDTGTAFAAGLEIETGDGRILRARETLGSAPGPERLRTKFAATAGRLLPPARVRALAAAVEHAETATPAALLALCRPDP
jgi:hypothetical protein